MKASFELIEVAGFAAALEGMRYPTKSVGDSEFAGMKLPDLAGFELGKNDAILASKLIKQGPVHAKFQRGITAWFRIDM